MKREASSGTFGRRTSQNVPSWRFPCGGVASRIKMLVQKIKPFRRTRRDLILSTLAAATGDAARIGSPELRIARKMIDRVRAIAKRLGDVPFDMPKTHVVAWDPQPALDARVEHLTGLGCRRIEFMEQPVLQANGPAVNRSGSGIDPIFSGCVHFESP